MKDQHTFESVDRHMNSIDLQKFEQGGATHDAVSNSAANPAIAISGICEAYQSVKPFLELVVGVPFLPKKWKEVIEKFMQVADLLCR